MTDTVKLSRRAARADTPPEAGTPVGRIVVNCSSNPRYPFDAAAGRPVVLVFLRHAGDNSDRERITRYRERNDVFDDRRASVFFVTPSPYDCSVGRPAEALPGYRSIWDVDGAFAERLGVRSGRRWAVVLDERLRLAARIDAEQLGEIEAVVDALGALPEPLHIAPVLVVPRVLEPALCEKLIQRFRPESASPGGFVREEDAGITRLAEDRRHARRTDWLITEPRLKAVLRERFERSLVPAVQQAFQFAATHVERYLVTHYAGAQRHYDRLHRDNTTSGTAHRRFAVTLNLNDGYDGGALRYPEFGDAIHRPPPGAAIVYSCSLLHEATPVTRGDRFALLSFLYDDAGEAERLRNVGATAPQDEFDTADMPEDPAAGWA
jgi:hypothetical protein